MLIALYYLWTALLSNRASVAGYERAQLITYVLMMTLLRAIVLACVTDRIPSEIAKGKLSDLLLQPISPIGFWAVQDAAAKALNLASAVIELAVFMGITKALILLPSSLLTWIYFLLAITGGMIIYFQMSYLLGVMGFWTAQSWGPRFCFEIFLEFAAGSYFPLDFLPKAFQQALSVLPFPYLVFYPLAIFLGRVTPSEIGRVFLLQAFWIALLGLMIRWLWRKGLTFYAAEGR